MHRSLKACNDGTLRQYDLFISLKYYAASSAGSTRNSYCQHSDLLHYQADHLRTPIEPHCTRPAIYISFMVDRTDQIGPAFPSSTYHQGCSTQRRVDVYLRIVPGLSGLCRRTLLSIEQGSSQTLPDGTNFKRARVHQKSIDWWIKNIRPGPQVPPSGRAYQATQRFKQS